MASDEPAIIPLILLGVKPAQFTFAGGGVEQKHPAEFAPSCRNGKHF